jgi:hypothetical protein
MIIICITFSLIRSKIKLLTIFHYILPIHAFIYLFLFSYIVCWDDELITQPLEFNKYN